jgi:hypothetical protein
MHISLSLSIYIFVILSLCCSVSSLIVLSVWVFFAAFTPPLITSVGIVVDFTFVFVLAFFFCLCDLDSRASAAEVGKEKEKEKKAAKRVPCNGPQHLLSTAQTACVQERRVFFLTLTSTSCSPSFKGQSTPLVKLMTLISAVGVVFGLGF